MNRSKYPIGVRRRVLSSSIAAILLCSAQSAWAQSASDDTSQSADDVDEITVTGTRIRRSDFQAANAISTLTAEDIEALGIVSVAEMMNQMTANVASYGLDTGGSDSAFFVGATLANLRGMNTAFGTRTLTLVDGRRLPETTNGGAVDLAMIPSVLVGRMETVTGGASATYGSDAIAGVVNIVLNREIEGTRLQAGYGRSHAGDGSQYNFSIANGTRLLNNRGHFTVGFEHQTIDPIYDCHTARDWCGRGFNIIDLGSGGANQLPFGASNDPRDYDPLPALPNPLMPGQGYSRWQVFENVRYLHSSPYGSIHTNNARPDDPMNGIFLEFTPDGTDVVEYQAGLTGSMRDYAYGGSNRQVIGGDGLQYYHGRTLRQGSERNNLYGRFIYAFSDRTSLTTELSFNRNDGVNPFRAPNRYRETHCVGMDNAFRAELSATAQEVLFQRRTLGDGSFFAPGGCSVDSSIFLSDGVWAGGANVSGGTNILKNWSEQLHGSTKTNTEMTQIRLSLNGGLFSQNNWTYDAYLSYGITDRSQELNNLRTNRRWGMAMDAVVDANTGEIVCRVNESGDVGQAARDTYAS